MSNIEMIRKRDGSLVSFDINKIKKAVSKAMQTSGNGTENQALLIAKEVKAQLEHFKREMRSFIPEVEGIQDTVERTLIYERFGDAAKAYILYRERRNMLRERVGKVSPKYKELANNSKAYFDSVYSEIVFLRTYARWLPEEARRETWIECVDRFMNFMRSETKEKLSNKEYIEVREAILKQEIMPSMRLMQFAGKAAKSTNVCAYNCAFIAPTKIKHFAEGLYVLMCGTGLGFSVEDQAIQQLPMIRRQTGNLLPTHQVADSREGWAEALRIGMEAWYEGNDIEFDYDLVRPAGARLKTFGGKSSGPAPLKSLLLFARTKILAQQGSRLKPIDVHDIITKEGEIVIVGGVRRSALISLSDFKDNEMRDAKQGHFYMREPQRSMANNSAVYNHKPTNTELISEWMALINSGSGERGIFNRGGLVATTPTRRLEYLNLKGYINNNKITGIIGTNPCGEIILKGSGQFCNLSEVICRATDTVDNLKRKIRLASLIGTFQSTLTNFTYLSKEWKINCEDERLLGVSLTGQWDCKTVRNPRVLKNLRAEAVETNLKYAQKFGINPSNAITAVKPSGNVSQLVNCSSGMHQRYAPYYIRRIRVASTDAICTLLKDQKVPHSPEVGQDPEGATTWVFDFPMKSPEGSVFQNEMTAVEQLEYWKSVKVNYTEHNPSVTIYIANDDWINVLTWIENNWTVVGGISFLPKSDTVYQLAPYEEINEEQYNKLAEALKHVDLTMLPVFEIEDGTDIKAELACQGASCEF